VFFEFPPGGRTVFEIKLFVGFQSLWNIAVTVGKLLEFFVLMCDSSFTVTGDHILGDFSSVTEQTPLVGRSLSERQFSFYPQDIYVLSDPEFSVVIQESEAAIVQGVYPQRNKKGSSGSYFVSNLAGVCKTLEPILQTLLSLFLCILWLWQ